MWKSPLTHVTPLPFCIVTSASIQSLWLHLDRGVGHGHSHLLLAWLIPMICMRAEGLFLSTGADVRISHNNYSSVIHPLHSLIFHCDSPPHSLRFSIIIIHAWLLLHCLSVGLLPLCQPLALSLSFVLLQMQQKCSCWSNQQTIIYLIIYLSIYGSICLSIPSFVSCFFQCIPNPVLLIYFYRCRCSNNMW